MVSQATNRKATNISATARNVRYVRKERLSRHPYKSKMEKELEWLSELAEFRHVNQ